MQETLLVCSKSTRDFFLQYNRVYLVSKEPTKDILALQHSEEKVIAVGGGAVIDTAKIICKNPIICFPTTASGSACTSHSVYWDGKKKFSLKRQVPAQVYVEEKFLTNLPKNIILETTYDALSHCLDSMWSKNRTTQSLDFVNQSLEILRQKNIISVDLVRAGNIAGKAIEICPTTILHSLSYPLTGIYGISHGKALGFLLYEVAKFMNFDVTKYIDKPNYHFPNLDYELLVREAMTYSAKLFEIEKTITIDDVKNIYRNSNKK